MTRYLLYVYLRLRTKQYLCKSGENLDYGLTLGLIVTAAYRL